MKLTPYPYYPSSAAGSHATLYLHPARRVPSTGALTPAFKMCSGNQEGGLKLKIGRAVSWQGKKVQLRVIHSKAEHGGKAANFDKIRGKNWVSAHGLNLLLKI